MIYKVWHDMMAIANTVFEVKNEQVEKSCQTD